MSFIKKYPQIKKQKPNTLIKKENKKPSNAFKDASENVFKIAKTVANAIKIRLSAAFLYLVEKIKLTISSLKKRIKNKIKNAHKV